MLLLPGYELDGFPRTATSQESDELLSGWVAMWHPEILAALDGIPRWQQVEQPPEDLDDSLFVLPSICKKTLPEDLLARIEASSGSLVEAQPPWRDLQSELIRRVRSLAGIADPPVPATEANPLDELLPEFAALGYAYLQIQLMTRQLRYASNLDLPQFAEQAVAAAKAALENEPGQALDMIQACLDCLGQERDHYYSLDVHLVDLTLVASTTLGGSLQRQLDSKLPTSYLASGSELQQLSDRAPERLAQLNAAVETNEACIAGGLDKQRPHPLMTRAAIVRDYYRGRAAYQKLNVQPPTVFNRMRYGQLPTSAALQKRFGYSGSLLLALSGGRYPAGSHAKVSWESPDGTFLNALSGSVMDASDPASFLALGWEIGDALDHQHVPTLIMAHWPGRGCEFYHLMHCIAKRTPAMGKWMLLDSYFQDTDQPYHQERLAAADFNYNWLAESESPARLLVSVKFFHQLAARLQSAQNLSNLAWQLENAQSGGSSAQALPPASTSETQIEATDPPAETPEPPIPPQPLFAWDAILSELQERADGLLDDDVDAEQAYARALGELNQHVDSLLARLARKLLGKAAVVEAKPGADSAPAELGILALNPNACPVRECIQLSRKQSLSADLPWRFAEGRVGNEQYASLDIPSHGFVSAGCQRATNRSGSEPVLAEAGGLLRNEFMEVQIDNSRGHLRSLHAPGRRGNRLSVQVARRTVDGQGKRGLSEMVASEVRMLTSSNMNGLVRATGQFKTDNQSLGKFEIDYELWRGSRVLEATIRLFDLPPIEDRNPWRDAYVVRVAWPSDAAILRSYSCGTQYAWPGGKTISPRLVQIDESEYCTYYLTGGLAFHRRTESRFLETILATAGQTEVKHTIAFGIDLPHPQLSAARLLDRTYHAPVKLDAKAAAGASGWLATVDVANVTVDLDCPLVDAQQNTVGVRLSVCERVGKSTGAAIRLFREVASARRVDYLGETVSDLTVKDDKLTLPLRANEQTCVDVIWK